MADLIQKGDTLFTIDLQDGFHHVKLHPDFTKYLGFYWRGKFYEWQVLCFGVSIAPYYFHKLIRPVVQHLRSNNVRLAPFVDDFLLMVRQLVCQQQKAFTLTTLQTLGWHPNWDKCNLEESTTATFVGFNIDSNTDNGPWLKVLPSKLRKLKRAIIQIFHRQYVSVRSLARVAGQCIAMTKAIIPGKLLLRNIYRCIATKNIVGL